MSKLRTDSLQNLTNTIDVDIKNLEVVNESYVDRGTYSAGITINSYLDKISVAGIDYRVKRDVVLPITTTGDWGVDSSSFTYTGDDKLREDLLEGDGSSVGIGSGNTLADLVGANGAGLIPFDENTTYPDGSVGSDLARAVKGSPTNAAWAGFFACWPMGHSYAVGTVERIQVPAGVTHGRTGFVAGTTITHADGQKSKDALRIQRNATTSDEANHTVVMNLTTEETKPLRGKTCTMHFYARAGADYSGSNISYRVQSSVEPEQPILSSVGNYTNGHEVLATANTLPAINQPDTPYSLTFNVPEDTTQLAVVFTIRFAGVAGTNDYIELEEVALYEGQGVSKVSRPDFSSLLNKSYTRYQSSYQYGVPFGSNTRQGSLSAVAINTAINWAFNINVKFSPEMCTAPKVKFAAPGTGIRSRWLNVDAGTFINGLAFDVSTTGVTFTNNAAAVAGNRYLCHWVAETIF